MARKEKDFVLPTETAPNSGGDPAPSSAPVAATAVVEPEEFQKGGRFRYEGHENMKGQDVSLFQYRKALYMDSDGKSYDARVSPLPVNKGSIKTIPAVENVNQAYDEIRKLPLGEQLDALSALHAKMSKGCEALQIGDEVIRLIDYSPSNGAAPLKCRSQLYTHPKTGQNMRVPVADLIVNFSRQATKSDWKVVANVRPVDSVPSQVGMRVPHFVLVP